MITSYLIKFITTARINVRTASMMVRRWSKASYGLALFVPKSCSAPPAIDPERPSLLLSCSKMVIVSNVDKSRRTIVSIIIKFIVYSPFSFCFSRAGVDGFHPAYCFD